MPTANNNNDEKNDRARIAAAMCVGAMIGGVCGWLYLTENGGEIRARADQTLDRVLDDLKQARAAGEKANAVLTAGRQLLSDFMAVRNSA